MLAEKTPAERRQLEELGLDKPIGWDFFERAPRNADDSEFADAADDAVDYRTPIDAIEPEATKSDLAELCQVLEDALRWAAEAKSLVEMGWRMAAMMKLLQPALLEGMALEAKAERTRLEKDTRELRRALNCAGEILRAAGEHYKSLLAWVRRCDSLSELGQRGFAMIYVIRRALIDGATNARLGAMSGITRQAFNKKVMDFKDSHFGYRNEVMRSDTTRTRCRLAQTFAN